KYTDTLSDLLMLASSKSEEEYKCSGYLTLRKAVQAAESVSANAGAAQNDVSEAVFALASALSGLTPNVTAASGTVFGSGGSYTPGYDYTNMLDGNLSTYADFASPGAGTAGVDLGYGMTARLAYFRYYPRTGSGLNDRIKDEVIEGSLDGTNWTALGKITKTAEDHWFTVPIKSEERYRYFRLNCPSGSYGSLFEIEFYIYSKDVSEMERYLEVLSTLPENSPQYLREYAETKIPVLRAYIASSQNYTQKEINDEVIALAAVIDGAQSRIAFGSKLESFIQQDGNAYSALSYRNAYDAYLAAKQVYDDEASDDAAIAAAEAAFDQALTELSAVGPLQAPSSEAYFGEGGTWNESGESYLNMFDGKITTYSNYDSSHTSGGYGGFDLGEGNEQVITRIRYYYDDQWNRVYGRFEGSNDKETWTTLAEYAADVYPKATWNEIPVNDTTPYRYLRVYSTNGNGNVCEVEFYAAVDTSLLQDCLARAASYTDSVLPSYADLQADIAAAKAALAGQTALRDITALCVLMEKHMAELDVQAQDADLLQKIADIDQNLYTSYSYFAVVDALQAYRSGNGSASDLQTAYDALTKLSSDKITAPDTDAYYGYGGTWGGSGESYLKMFDGDTSTYADFASSSNGKGEGGFDLGENCAAIITKVRYYLRADHPDGYANGSIIAASNDKANYQTLVTVMWYDQNGTWIDIDVNNSTPYRYLNVMPVTQCNGGFSEVEFYGLKPDFTMLNALLAQAQEVVNQGVGAQSVLQSLAAEIQKATAVKARGQVIQKAVNDEISVLRALLESVDTVTLSFDNRVGAGGAIEALHAKAGETLYLPECGFDAVEGYTFVGYTDGENVYQPYAAFRMPANDVTLYAAYRATLTATAQSDTVAYLEGCYTVAFDKPVDAASVTTAALGAPSVSYVSYDEETNSAKGYVNYKSVKPGTSFTVTLDGLHGYQNTVSYTVSQSLTFTVALPQSNADNMIPNGSFDLPWATDYMDGEIAAVSADGEGYSLHVPLSSIAYNYAKWYVSYNPGKHYMLSYDAMPDSDYEGNDVENGAVCAAVPSAGADTYIGGISGSKGAWIHFEKRIPDTLSLSDGMSSLGIYSNPVNNKSISWYVDNIVLREVYPLVLQDYDGNTLSTSYYAADAVYTFPKKAGGTDVYAWTNGKALYIPVLPTI
ncbi:MAG: discoidin domain-containing protein, partial [Eubacteriales bacterium]